MKKDKETGVVGFKGFDKDLKCRDFQYKIGEEFSQQENIGLCDSGFHFCEMPLNVFSYYPLQNGNRYASVIGKGKVKSDEGKSVTDKIFISSEIDIAGIVKASVKYISEKAKVGGIFKKKNATSGDDAHSATSGSYAHSATSGDDAHSATSGYGANSATSGDDAHSATSGKRANSATSGDDAHSATSGDDAHSATSGSYAHSATSGKRANSATSGYGAHSATSGDDAIAVSVGRKAKAKASLGCFIVLAEWKEGKEFTDAKPLGVISAKVDGKKIKADQWYKAVNGSFVETDDSNE
jgi:hypothetical protein